MIKSVTPEDMMAAAYIHSESWQQSHRDICTPAFLALHTPEHQRNYLESEIEKGAKLYMLTDQKPVGIVTVWGSLIENLYILPDEQNKGYGTKLLVFAMEKCTGTPTLWILSGNEGARRLYERHGFRLTGNRNQIAEGLYELELQKG